jgi:predicted Zn-dependent protease
LEAQGKGMQSLFNQFAKDIFQKLQVDEALSLSLSGEKTLFTRLNQAKIRQITSIDQGSIKFTFLKNGRHIKYHFPFGSDSKINFEQGKKILEKCREDVNQLSLDPFCPEINNLGNSEEHHKGSFPEDENWMDVLSPMIKDLDCAGILTAGCVMRGNINSLGQSHWYESENFCLDLSFYTPSQKAVKLIYADKNWSKKLFQDKLDFSKEQLSKLDSLNKTLAPGKYRTYFAPEAVCGFLNILSWNGVGASSYYQGQSAFKLIKDGDATLSPLFTLCEDFSKGSSPRFNSLGELAPMSLAIVEKGQLKNLLTSTRSAKEYKLETNYADSGEGLRAPSISTGSLQESEILKTLDTGLFVSNVHYLNWSDLNKGRITGMTRYACFWVEDGKIVSPIKDMRFDETLYHFWGEGLLNLTDKSYLIAETDTYDQRSVGGSLVPGMLIDDFSYTL